MSLTTMQSHESLRFLDDLNFPLSLDNRKTADHQMTSIEIFMQPIILRASPPDIGLILGIVSRAMTMYSSQASMNEPSPNVARPSTASRPSRKATSAPVRSVQRRSSFDKPRVYMSKEKVRISHSSLNRQKDLHLTLYSSMHSLKDYDSC